MTALARLAGTTAASPTWCSLRPAAPFWRSRLETRTTDAALRVTGPGRAASPARPGPRPAASLEFRYGSLTRSVRLPAKVDAKDVKARYEKGILEVSIPVPEGTRIAIEKAG